MANTPTVPSTKYPYMQQFWETVDVLKAIIRTDISNTNAEPSTWAMIPIGFAGLGLLGVGREGPLRTLRRLQKGGPNAALPRTVLERGPTPPESRPISPFEIEPKDLQFNCCSKRSFIGTTIFHPVANDLQSDAANLRRLGAARAVVNRRKGQQSSRLRTILCSLRRCPHRACVIISPEDQSLPRWRTSCSPSRDPNPAGLRSPLSLPQRARRIGHA